jgi:hypothetical protein
LGRNFREIVEGLSKVEAIVTAGRDTLHLHRTGIGPIVFGQMAVKTLLI